MKTYRGRNRLYRAIDTVLKAIGMVIIVGAIYAVTCGLLIVFGVA